MNLSFRAVYSVAALICLAVIGGAFFIEYEYMISPCPLCTLQRIAYYCLIALFLIAACMPPKRCWFVIHSCAVLLCTGFGLFIASRQLWLQYYAPKQDFSCAASLERLIDLYPFLDALKIALQGSRECATVDFTIMGISLAGWSVLLFGTIGILTCYALAKRYLSPK